MKIKKTKNFIIFLLSVFALILFTQVKWMYERDVYDHIAARFIFSALLTIPAGFLITLVVSPFLSIFKRGEDVIDLISALVRPLLLLFLSLIVLYEKDLAIDEPTKALSFLLIPAALINLYFVRVLVFGKNSVDLSYKDCVIYSFKWYWVELARFFKAFSQVSHFKVAKFPITVYPLARFILLFQIIVVIKFSTASASSFIEFVLLVISTIVTTVLCVDIIMSISPKPIRILLSIAVALFYSFLSTYHYAQNTSLDFALFITNLDLILYNESMEVAGDNLSPLIKNTVYLFFGAAILFQFLFGLFSPKVKTVRKKRVFFAKGGLYLVIVFLLPVNADELSGFLNSIKNYQSEKNKIEMVNRTLTKEFPYQRDSIEQGWKVKSEIRPNIIFVALESFNGLMVDEFTSEGVEITPFINSLKDKGLFIKNYYGNSVQTSRGLLSLHGGILPSFRKKIMVNHEDLNLRSLPKILRNENYMTLFIKAYRKLSFDNNGPFMKHIGFEHVLAMTDERISEDEKKYVWGWGLQDDIYYKKCLDIIDSLHSTSGDSIKKPFFLSLITVSNHMKFNHLPKDKKYIYPNSTNSEHRKNLTNSMHLTDKFLKTLFNELDNRGIAENTIVVVTGDHSFPRGDFGIYNQCGFYEENFRTPMAIIWKGKIKPQVINDVAYSHVDIAPTVMDLLNIQSRNHFTGKSIFVTGERTPVLLSQPYDGLYLASVKYPYKFVQCMSSGKEYLFNISTKDGELFNLIKDDKMCDIVDELKLSLNDFYVNQTLIENNRIWPANIEEVAIKNEQE